MKIGVLINARLNSTRFPKKHLQLIEGKYALQHLVDRLPFPGLIIATGDKKTNGKLARIDCFIEYADSNNIPLRHAQIAAKHKFDAIVSIDGDDIFTSPHAVAAAIKTLQGGAELVRTEGLPLGFNVLWGYSTQLLSRALRECAPQERLDTGWGWVFPKKSLYTIRYDIKGAERVRASLDYQADLEWFRRVIKACPKNIIHDDEKLVKWILANGL